MGHHHHRTDAPRHVDVAVLSISSTRTLKNDESGHWIVSALRRADHRVVAHHVVTDAVAAIRKCLRDVVDQQHPQAVICTGGTGIAPKDVTIEALKPLFAKELGAFATLFAMLSHAEIGSAALLSRAAAGIIDATVVFSIPGSLKACKLACNQLILPELGHLARHIQE